mmetsp:Transcript_1409/g.4301  ORF Transcript_1409/g.4301 Transcript_1409/m.4301 type:complete len:207 (-) Transcript_1409:209-829(-)
MMATRRTAAACCSRAYLAAMATLLSRQKPWPHRSLISGVGELARSVDASDVEPTELCFWSGGWSGGLSGGGLGGFGLPSCLPSSSSSSRRGGWCDLRARPAGTGLPSPLAPSEGAPAVGLSASAAAGFGLSALRGRPPTRRFGLSSSGRSAASVEPRTVVPWTPAWCPGGRTTQKAFTASPCTIASTPLQHASTAQSAAASDVCEA